MGFWLKVVECFYGALFDPDFLDRLNFRGLKSKSCKKAHLKHRATLG
ncbi:hypothetical protein HBZC1_13220 [Helicobacter bizzozeronii CIII-1]|uniref:Uncharacterized protein n=1 Tax=Helicobacter bizzozeronii (strain CIII-1) TaxID=1002804 RepID=F8KTX8_HELBC|nr:hypothetical protein [Helicobacter bizzozeronii]CCB80308.1 hypothetical protein HBZC1_13220 [Helicobacter bizzozeronii CIII-1]